jgi:FAD/FMN-containing dehydrogenase
VFEAGAYFSRPYGEWAAMAFGADPETAELTRTVKGIFDPNNVMNPGKLCFPATVGPRSAPWP